MKKIIVVGGGAGGAAAAKKLAGKFDVTVIEEGGAFKPFSVSLSALAALRKTGLFLDEREIQLLFPAMKIHKTNEMVFVKGKGLGGTTTLSAGNAVRQDAALKDIGVNLDAEFEELYASVPVTASHQNNWGPATLKLYEIFQSMNLAPFPLPKFGDYNRCVGCGQCVLGCRYGAKWDSRKFLSDAQAAGAKLITHCKIKKVATQGAQATGVITQSGKFIPADYVVLAAGGFSTPVILQNSNIPCGNSLFVDPVLCVAAEVEGVLQNKGVSMPFAAQKEHFILSPYFDYLSFFFNKAWKKPAQNILPLMIKLADETTGGVDKAHAKHLTDADKQHLKEGADICKEVLLRFGARKESIFMGTINAGHPGGMLPLTPDEAETLHNPRLPGNLYVADATLFPKSLGNPPILTVMALATKAARLIFLSN